MLRKQVKKYGLALGLGISMLLLAGCEKKSVDDLYNMTESTSKEEIQTSKNGNSDTASDWYVHNETYINWNSSEKPELIPQGEIYTVSFSKRSLTFRVDEAVLTKDFNDLKQLTTESSYKKLENYYLNVDNSNNIDEEGKVNLDRQGLEQNAIFIKTNIVNEMDEVSEFCATNLRICCIKQSEANLSYRILCELDVLDCPDAWDIHGINKVTLQPHESREITLIGFINTELINQYYYKYDKEERKNYFKDFVSEELPIDSLYMTTRYSDLSEGAQKNKGFEGNKALLKLDVK